MSSWCCKKRSKVFPRERYGFIERELNRQLCTIHRHPSRSATRRPEHEAQISELGIEKIDLVVVNLYPF